MARQLGDGWNAAATYDDFMGRWSRPLAEEFVRWIDAAPEGHWLDVGTGTGALASAICHLGRPASVVGCDRSESFVAAAQEGLRDPRVKFQVAGVGALPSRQGGYDLVVSGLALNFFPEPLRAVQEQLSLLRSGGAVAALVWDYADGMEFLRHFWDAAASVEPSAAELDEGRRFPICKPDALASLFGGAGLRRVRTGSVVVPTVFSSFEDYWRPLLGATGPAPSFVATLSDQQRRSLEADLRERLGGNSGPIELAAKAWAVFGTCA